MRGGEGEERRIICVSPVGKLRPTEVGQWERVVES